MKRTKEFILSILSLFLVVTTIYLGSEVMSLKKEVNQLQKNSSATQLQTDNKTQVVQVNTTINSSVSDVYNQVKESVVTVKNIVDNRIIGSGSGVIYKGENGSYYIVTNNHVIQSGDRADIVLYNGETLKAELLGSDLYADLAVLKVNSSLKLKPIVLGDSSAVKVGETVLAIGSPTGVDFSGSLSVGVLSGKDRRISVDLDGNGRADWDMVMLQTDAAINPGNSGGALVNMAGQLVGINTIKIVGDSVEGLGFSNPINEVISIVSQLEKNGKVMRPSIGIMGRSMAELNILGRFYGDKRIPNLEKGLYVIEVVKEGPAAKAGIQEGDVIVKFDGVEVEEFKDFRAKLYQHKPHDTIQITINRNGKEIELKVTLN